MTTTQAEFNVDLSRELGRMMREWQHDQIEAGIARGDPRCYRGGKNFWTHYTARNGRRMFCWTVRPDTNGDFWSFDYVRHGSGKRTTWKATPFVRCARRCVAKAKAVRRYRRYHKQQL